MDFKPCARFSVGLKLKIEKGEKNREIGRSAKWLKESSLIREPKENGQAFLKSWITRLCQTELFVASL